MFNIIKNNSLIKLYNKAKDDDIFALASQLAYSLILSFFPFLIFLFTVAGYSSIESKDVLFSLESILPYEAYSLIDMTVIEVFDSRKGDLLSFSFITTVWIASNGFHAVIRALNKAYDEKECRPFWKLQLISISSTLGLTFLIIFSFFILVLGNVLRDKFALWIGNAGSLYFIWNFSRYLLTLVIMVFIFALLYKITPCKKLTLFDALPGAIFTTIGWIISSMGFSYYVDNFANYSRLYGSIGAVIALLVWLFLTSVIILMGGEINSVLGRGH